jgi:hypothetical protein
MKNPPVTLAKIAIGDGTIVSAETFELLPVVSVLLADGVFIVFTFCRLVCSRHTRR